MNGDAGVKGVNVIFINGFVVVVVDADADAAPDVDVTGVADVFDIPCDGVNL
jgi:predicted RNA-binding protein with TRAM domain